MRKEHECTQVIAQFQWLSALHISVDNGILMRSLCHREEKAVVFFKNALAFRAIRQWQNASAFNIELQLK